MGQEHGGSSAGRYGRLARRGCMAAIGLGALGLTRCSLLTWPTPEQMPVIGGPKPSLVVVRPFAVSPEEVNVTLAQGTAAASLAGEAPRAKRELEVGHRFSRTFATRLAQDIQEAGLQTEVLPKAPVEGDDVLLIYGQFLSLSADPYGGLRIVGFAATYPDVVVDLELFERRKGQARLIETLESSVTRGPDAVAADLMPASVLATAQGLTPAAATALDQGAAAAARKVARDLIRVFAHQGWTHGSAAG